MANAVAHSFLPKKNKQKTDNTYINGTRSALQLPQGELKHASGTSSYK